MAQFISRPSTEQLLATTEGNEALHHELSKMSLCFDELQIAKGSVLDGQNVGDIDLHGNRGFLIVAVRKADGSVVVDPEGSCSLAAGDSVVILGHVGEIPQLAKRYTLNSEITYRGAKLIVSG